MSLQNQSLLYSSLGNLYAVVLRFDTNSTSTPDGLEPDTGEWSISRTGVGDYKITIDGDRKPYKVWSGWAEIEGDEPRLSAKVTGYTRSSGELTVTVYQEQDDGSDTDPDNGISVAADTTDKTVVVTLLATRYKHNA